MSCTPRPLVSISAVRRQEIGSVVHTRQTDLDLILLLDFRPARDIPNSIQIAQSGALDVNADAAFRANSISVNSSTSFFCPMTPISYIIITLFSRFGNAARHEPEMAVAGSLLETYCLEGSGAKLWPGILFP